MAERERTFDEPPEEEAPVIEIEPDRYPWADTKDRMLRSFIAEQMASADIDGRFMVENMQMAFDWIMQGTIPAKASKKP